MNVSMSVNTASVTFDAERDERDWKFPLMLSCLAGASTSVGAGIVFLFSPSTIQQSMSFSLSLAASVMITVSVISIGPECLEGMIESDATSGTRILNSFVLFERLACFASGCGSYYLLSRLLVALPEPEAYVVSMASSDKYYHDGNEAMGQQQLRPNVPIRDNSRSPKQKHGATRRAINRDSSQLTPSITGSNSAESLESATDELVSVPSDEKSKATNSLYNAEDRRRSWRVAMLLFVSLLCHNFPEGLAVVASTAESRALGVTVAIGIMIHNIPEGIAIAVPCMAARPDAPWFAFGLASISGLAEPLGALLAISVLNSTESLPLENILACVAGIMCMVAVLELYPEAYRHVRHQNFQGMLGGTLVGALIMIATEWYLP